MTLKFRRFFLFCVFVPLALLAYFAPVFSILGFLNRRFRWFDTLFFVYPASATYARSYAPDWFTGFARWMPCPIGLLRAPGSRGLVVGALMTEQDFLARKNSADFGRLLRRIERLSGRLGTDSVRLCGILPSVAAKRGESFFEDTSSVAADAVLQAFIEVRRREHHANPATMAILIGGAGLVGAKVAGRMAEAGIPHEVLDPAAGEVDPRVLSRAGPMILVDVARKGVLRRYLPHILPGTVILNETYPEPDRLLQARIRAIGGVLYHIRGVAGSVWPPLPGGYGDAIPCCGAPVDGRRIEVRLTRLVPEEPRTASLPGPQPQPEGAHLPALLHSMG